jgi:hypothetical protein
MQANGWLERCKQPGTQHRILSVARSKRIIRLQIGQKGLWVYSGATPFASLLDRDAKLMSGLCDGTTLLTDSHQVIGSLHGQCKLTKASTDAAVILFLYFFLFFQEGVDAVSR